MSSYRKSCIAGISAAIQTWPTELSAIVSEYAVADVRWLADQRKIKISADGKQAEIDSYRIQDAELIDGYAYIAIVGQRPLSETTTSWTVDIEVKKYGGYSSRIGVRRTTANFLSPRMQFDVRHMMFQPTDAGGPITFHPASLRCRFVLTADLDVGRLTVRRSDESVDWFSIAVSSAVLAASVPVVYLYGVGDRVCLT